MSVLDIRLYGDPVLRRKADPVSEINDEVREFAEDLIDTMYEAEGVGLAAPQVGVSVRMLVADAEYNKDRSSARVFINPEILEADGEWKYEEGCLSIPGIRADVKRPERILLRYTDLSGETHEEEMNQVWARVLQHEIDHIDGKLFIDYLGAIKRSLIKKTLQDLEYESALYLEKLEEEDGR